MTAVGKFVGKPLGKVVGKKLGIPNGSANRERCFPGSLEGNWETPSDARENGPEFPTCNTALGNSHGVGGVGKLLGKVETPAQRHEAERTRLAADPRFAAWVAGS